MPVAAGVAVAAAMGGGAVAAVAGAMVTGAITGAIIGAGVALVTGQNPLKSALKGAMIGAVTAGLVKGIGIAASGTTTTAANTGKAIAESGAEATNTLADASANITGEGLSTAANASKTVVPESQGLLSKVGDFVSGSGGKTLTDAQTIARSNVHAGIGQGLMTGVANYGTSMMESNEAKELEEWKEKQIELNRIGADDLPSFKADTINLKLPDRWNSNLKREGLLA